MIGNPPAVAVASAAVQRSTCLALLLMLCMTPLVSAQSQQTFDAIRIANVTVSPDEARFGYVDHTFVIENRSDSQTHRVTLTAPRSNYGSDHRISRLTRSVELPPGARARLSIPQPPVSLSGSGFSVSIDGRQQRDGLRSAGSGSNAFGPSWSRSGGEKVFVLASYQAMDTPSVMESRGRFEYEFTRHSESPGQWSRQWLSYSPYAAVVVTADEWRAAPPEVRSALLDYTRAGGVLALLGDVELPAESEAEPFENGHAGQIGFGQMMQIDESKLGYELGNLPWSRLTDAAADTHEALVDRMSMRQAHQRFPVLDDIAVPVRSLFALLVVFAVVAGPVNLIVLSRKKRRIWLLWTTPLISLVFCGSVFAYSVLADGITPTIRLATVTVLDQQEHRAVTRGMLGYHAPLSPSDGLRFDANTELTQQFSDDWQEAGRPRTVAWVGNEQHLASGWVTAGVPSHFRVRRVATDRRRLQVDHDDEGTPVLINNLEAPLVSVQYMDAGGAIHRADEIAAGERATTRQLGEAVVARTANLATASRSLRGMLSQDVSAVTGWDDENLRAVLKPGWYVAVLETSPFVDPSLTRYHTRPQQSVVFGKLGAGDFSDAAARSEVQP
ncbi:MAG: hypothetical protein WD294_14330 [Phycisphaeraceae bacterium]